MELDPQFAAAWAGLVEARVFIAFSYSETESRRSARQALDRLEVIGPDSPELHRAHALWLCRGEQRYHEALDELDAFTELRPGDWDAMLTRGALYRRLARWTEAARAHAYTVIGRHDEAVEELRELLSIPADLVSVPLLRLDVRWDRLRDHPGFQALVAEDG